MFWETGTLAQFYSMKHIDILYLALYLILISAITGFVFIYLANEFGNIDKNLWLVASTITLIIFSCTFFFDEVSYPKKLYSFIKIWFFVGLAIGIPLSIVTQILSLHYNNLLFYIFLGINLIIMFPVLLLSLVGTVLTVALPVSKVIEFIFSLIFNIIKTIKQRNT